MEELGGVARRMPVTWLAFAIGAAAIIGVPPFNGFVSEWLIYQGLFAGSESHTALRLAVLRNSRACADRRGRARVFRQGCRRRVSRHASFGAWCNRKRRGTRRLSADAGSCRNVRRARSISRARYSARPLPDRRSSHRPWASRFPQQFSGAWSISALSLATIVSCAVLVWLRSALMRGRVTRHEVTWACGYDGATPRMQYTASSFASPLLSVFGRLSGVHVGRSPRSLHTHPIDLILDGVALPVWHVMHRAALRWRAMHHGRLHLYLLYVMYRVLAMLGYLVVGSRF